MDVVRSFRSPDWVTIELRTSLTCSEVRGVGKAQYRSILCSLNLAEQNLTWKFWIPYQLIGFLSRVWDPCWCCTLKASPYC